jgi:hypothetical protein
MAHVLTREENETRELYPLQSKGNFDRIPPINRKATVDTMAPIKITDSGESNDGLQTSSILSESPNLYKQNGDFVSKNYVQLLRSDDTDSLLKSAPKAFLLLTYISLHATREYDPKTGLEEAECFISEEKTSVDCGLSTKEYRGAKIRLIKEEYIIEIFNPSWLKKIKSEKPRTNPELEKFKKRAMKRATKSCIVKLCKSTIYDINMKTKGDLKGDQRATKGRPKGDTQEGEEGKEVKETTTLPFFKEGIDDVSFEEKILIFSKSEFNLADLKEEYRKRSLVDVFLEQEEIEKCLEIHGDVKNIKMVILQIQTWPDRKYEIKNWFANIQKWVLKKNDIFKDRSQEEKNENLNLCRKFLNDYDSENYTIDICDTHVSFFSKKGKTLMKSLQYTENGFFDIFESLRMKYNFISKEYI